MNFAPGADWSERSAGTNAPGTALALGREIQIHGSEHFSRIVQPWSCTAAPVHDPDSGALLGAIDLTGGPQVGSAQTLALVRATAVAVENHLALLRLTGTAPEPAARRPHLVALGGDRSRWVTTDGYGHLRAAHLTGRHADILVLLSRHPEGLERRPPGRAPRRQGPRRGHGARGDVAAAAGDRRRVRRVAAVSTAGAHHHRRRRGVRRPGRRGRGIRAGALPGAAAPAIGVTGDRPAANAAVGDAARGGAGRVRGTARVCCGAGWSCPKAETTAMAGRCCTTVRPSIRSSRAHAGGHLAGLDFELG